MHRQNLRLLALAGVLALVPAAMTAQESATISGRVGAETGNPLGSASVFIEGLNIGTLTRDDGGYTLTVPSARAQGQRVTLTARLIGYKPQSAQITLSPGTITQNFTLGSNPLQLGELVITGAGTAIEAEKLGNVRNAVSAEQITKASEPNIVQALAAKAPNVQVTQSSGEPGSSSYIRIRGLRTVNSSAQPLFVVDGVPIDNSTFSTSNFNPIDELGFGETSGTAQMNRAVDINPNDIENVEILKGPAAGAIYGARAGQGVILITTKKGRPGQTRYSLRTSWSFDDINHKYPLQRQFAQGILGNPPTGTCNIGASACLRSWGPPVSTETFDHSNEAYDTGITSDNALTVSGGSERTTFFFSGSYFDQTGVFKGPSNRFERTTVRLNASHRLLDNLNLLANFQYADTRGNFVQRGNNANGLQLGLLRTPPNFNNLPYLDPTTGLHRSYRLPNPGVTSVGQSRGFDNPFYTLFEQENRSTVGRVFGNAGAEYQAADWLKLNYTLGADYSNDERLEGMGPEASDVSAGGRVTEGNITLFQLDHNLSATANYRVNPSIAGSLTLGQNLNVRNQRQIAVVGRELVAPEPFKLQNTVQRDLPIDDEENIHLESYFGQATLDLFDQLFLTFALRNDGSSTFGPANKRSWFPKASAAWTFTNYLQNQRYVSFGKLRAAYGEAGQEPDPYLTSSVFQGTTLLSGIVQGTGFAPTYLGFGGVYTDITRGNEDLKPERTKELELGFDLGLLNDAADVGFTFYNAETEDVILNTPLATSTGFFQQAQNAAKFRNRGVEVTFNVRPLRRPDMQWNVGLQYARNRSEVLELNGPEFVPVDRAFDPFNVIQKGQPIGVFRGPGFARCGISPGGMDAVIEGVDLDVECAGAPRGALYLNDDGFPEADFNERVLGDPNPDWTGAVNTAFTFRKLTFSGLLDIRVGGDIWNGTRGALLSYGTHAVTADRCTIQRTGTTITGCTGNDKRFGTSDWYPGPVAGPGVDPATGTGLLVPIGENWYKAAITGLPGTGLGPCPFTGVHEPCMEDGGFVKLRELSVTYSFMNDFVRRSLGFSNIDLRLAGRNLKTWTDYTGYDPETSLGGAVLNSRGFDYFNMPQTRSYLVSFTLNR